MKIRFDEQGYVNGYAELGDMEGAVEYTGILPDDFGPDTSFFYRLVDGQWMFDIQKHAAAQNRISQQDELQNLYQWFFWYDNQVMQYNRALRMGVLFDQDMSALDAEAMTKQIRIREIRGDINGTV